MAEELTVPCLMCDTPVQVEKADWEAQEAPAALCDGCNSLVHMGAVAWPMVKMLYVIRCQVASLYTRMEEAQRNMKRLFAAQQDMEQELLRARKAG